MLKVYKVFFFSFLVCVCIFWFLCVRYRYTVSGILFLKALVAVRFSLDDVEDHYQSLSWLIDLTALMPLGNSPMGSVFV